MTGAGDIRAVTRVLTLRPGLYLLRYVSAEDARWPPRILVHADPDCADGLRFQTMPGHEHQQLRKPGEVLVAAVATLTRVLVTTLRENSGLSDTITLKVDRLDQAEMQSAQPLAALPTMRAEPETGLRVAAYIDRLGDIIVDSPKWIGSSDSRSAISGLSVLWPGRPNDIEIEYAVSLLGQGRVANVTTGGFVGTRGQGRPVNGLFMSLTGARVDKYELRVAAVFSDGTRREASDQKIQMFGPTGREYLTAFMIELIRSSRASSSPEIPRSLSNNHDSSWANNRDAGRLQIHRPLRNFDA